MLLRLRRGLGACRLHGAGEAEPPLRLPLKDHRLHQLREPSERVGRRRVAATRRVAAAHRLEPFTRRQQERQGGTRVGARVRDESNELLRERGRREVTRQRVRQQGGAPSRSSVRSMSRQCGPSDPSCAASSDASAPFAASAVASCSSSS